MRQRNRVGHLLVLIIQDMNFEEPRLDFFWLAVSWEGFRSWEPHVELCQPILESINLRQAPKSWLFLCMYMRRSEGNLQESILSCHYVDP